MSPLQSISAFDVAVIGGGVVGCAIARELSHLSVKTCLIEAESDVGMGTSKANSAIFHTGFDSTPGSLEARLLREGYPLLKQYCEDTGIAFRITGAIMVAWNKKQFAELPLVEENARNNGITLEGRLSADDLYRREPNLAPGALGGLAIPGEGILCPFSPVIAFAREASKNGVSFFFSAPVISLQMDRQHTRLETTGYSIDTKWVVNAAGLYSDEIDQMAGKRRFQVSPRKGQLVIFDKSAASLVHHIILPVPTPKTKGVLLSPTVYGNVLLGPTAEDTDDKTDTETTEAGLHLLLQKGREILPGLLREEITASYAGLRAATDSKDYQIHIDFEHKYICVGGIRSTGLSSSMGIAKYVVETMQSAGLSAANKPHVETITVPPLGEHQLRPYRDKSVIRTNPEYGRIVCHCEKVTRGELLDACISEPRPTQVEGLRRRTRCLQGRCQGFHCQAEIEALLGEHSP